MLLHAMDGLAATAGAWRGGNGRAGVGGDSLAAAWTNDGARKMA